MFSYPIDQVTSAALIGVSSSFQSGVMMSFEHVIYQQLTEDEMALQTCSENEDRAHEQAKNYLPYTIFITSWMTVCGCIYVFLFDPEMKRSNADKNKSNHEME